MESYSNYQIPRQQLPVTAITRLLSMFVDHIIMSFCAMIFLVPQILLDLFGSFANHKRHAESAQFIEPGFILLFLVGFALYFCKDSFNGRSAAKRMFKLQVIDNKTGVVASPLQCFVRNITIILWPLEVIVTLASPERRLGDMLAGTKVVYLDPTIVQPKTDIKKVLLAFVLSYLILFAVTYPFSHIAFTRKLPIAPHVQRDRSV